MPTFVFWKDGGKIDEMKGANPSGLTQLVQRYAGPVRTATAKPAATASASGSGTSSGAAPAAAGGPAVEGVVRLTNQAETDISNRFSPFCHPKA